MLFGNGIGALNVSNRNMDWDVSNENLISSALHFNSTTPNLKLI